MGEAVSRDELSCFMATSFLLTRIAIIFDFTSQHYLGDQTPLQQLDKRIDGSEGLPSWDGSVGYHKLTAAWDT